MFCSKCGNQVADNDKFCRTCGNEITPDTNNISEKINVEAPTKQVEAQPPYCSNCGASVGVLKYCPACHTKTKKSYKKYCKYCGGIIENKLCSNCGTHAKTTIIETLVRIFCGFLFGFFYLMSVSLFVLGNKISALILFLFVLLVQIFVFRKKQIQKFRLKILNDKKRKLKFSLIYASVPILLVIGFVITGFIDTSSSIQNFSKETRAREYSKTLLQQSLKNPSSLKVHSSSVKDSFVDEQNIEATYDDLTYFKIEIDYSAQNGFGGYNRDTKEYYIVVDNIGGIEEISGTEFFTEKLN